MRQDDPVALEAAVRALLASDRLSRPTRAALQARLDPPAEAPRVFSPRQLSTLRALCLRLIPEAALVERIDLAGRFEAALAKGFTRGWRHAAAPTDRDLHRMGLDAIDEAAQARFDQDFAGLPDDAQDALLETACDADPAGDPALGRWFEEVLSALADLYYAHPLVQVSIGYDGMADAQGVRAVGPAAIAEEAAHLGG